MKIQKIYKYLFESLLGQVKAQSKVSYRIFPKLQASQLSKSGPKQVAQSVWQIEQIFPVEFSQ